MTKEQINNLFPFGTTTQELEKAQLPTETLITLKSITDLLGVRHDKAMVKVAKMVEEPTFGTVSILDIVYNMQGQSIKTYAFTQRQAIAVGASLNTKLLMLLMDKLDELQAIADDYETKHNTDYQLAQLNWERTRLDGKEVRNTYVNYLNLLHTYTAETCDTVQAIDYFCAKYTMEINLIWIN